MHLEYGAINEDKGELIMTKETTYTTIFEDEAEGLKITVGLEDGVEERLDKTFNLNQALWSLGNQLLQQAKEK